MKHELKNSSAELPVVARDACVLRLTRAQNKATQHNVKRKSMHTIYNTTKKKHLAAVVLGLGSQREWRKYK